MADLDHALRDERHTLNPGTTADLTTAAIFLVRRYLEYQYPLAPLRNGSIIRRRHRNLQRTE